MHYFTPFVVYDWMKHQAAEFIWADEGATQLQVTVVISPLHPHASSGPLHSVGKPELNPHHHSEHNGPKVVISSPESLIRVLSCHLFSQSNSSRQLNPLHQIRAPLYISPLFIPLLSIMVNPTSIRQAPFSVSIPRGGLITPGCFVCLFLGQRSWIEQPAGVDGEEKRARKGVKGWRCGCRGGGRGQRTQESPWLWRGQISNHRAEGRRRLLLCVKMVIQIIKEANGG